MVVEPFKLLIVDSIVTFEADYVGRGEELSERQQAGPVHEGNSRSYAALDAPLCSFARSQSRHEEPVCGRQLMRRWSKVSAAANSPCMCALYVAERRWRRQTQVQRKVVCCVCEVHPSLMWRPGHAVGAHHWQ
jgi:hypothetical protein